MTNWYSQYWAQTWYRNTYLVNSHEQIGQAKRKPREWNNIYDSGCNFTCLAMIIGIDPARLASELGTQKFFRADRGVPARYLSGKQRGLVWDRNAPERGQQIRIPKIWHPQLNQRVTITIKLVAIDETRDLGEGNHIVEAARERDLHIVCGSDKHSYLVAGTHGTEYFVWDPDPKDSERLILRGKNRLSGVFRDCLKKDGDVMEFWQYQVRFGNSKRNRPRE